MARSHNIDIPELAVCRRTTTDLKDVQSILKSVVATSEGFVSRHTSINERDDKSPTPDMDILHYDPPLILSPRERASSAQSNYTKPPSMAEPPKVSPERRTSSPIEITDGPGGGPRRSSIRHSPLYGEIIVLGTNGSLPCPPLSPKMTHRYVLKKQHRATGVSQIVRDSKESDESLSRVPTHTVSMTLAKSKKMCVMEFGPDHSMDMFQIGRSTDSAIDMVVVDTVEFEGKKVFNSSSAISRYACRILCEREPPYTARIYAAAFDINRKIQLSANAPSWSDGSTGSMDGLTTNGITILRPVGVFEAGVDPGQWLEVTVMGNIRQMRPSRSAREPGPSIPAETNVLTDGCLIDLCGITLMWRTAFGLDNGPSSTLLRERQQELNLLTPQCLVNFLTLHFKGGHLVTSPTSVPHDDDLREPWMYVNCGHVFGKHDWKWTDNETDTHRTCPICHKAGPYIKLELGNERAFFIDEGSFTHTFAPCGHVTTEQTARYWSKVRLPNMSGDWLNRCPYCSQELDQNKPYIKLYFN